MREAGGILLYRAASISTPRAASPQCLPLSVSPMRCGGRWLERCEGILETHKGGRGDTLVFVSPSAGGRSSPVPLLRSLPPDSREAGFLRFASTCTPRTTSGSQKPTGSQPQLRAAVATGSLAPHRWALQSPAQGSVCTVCFDPPWKRRLCLEVGGETPLLVLGTQLPKAIFASWWCPLRLCGLTVLPTCVRLK